jgi:hypothetical protein
VTLARDRATGGREVLGARIAEVVLRGPQAVPVGGGFDPTRIDRDQVMARAGGSGLGQQLLDHHFRLLVFALAEVVMADPPAGVSPRQHAPWVLGRGRSVPVGARNAVSAASSSSGACSATQ